MNKPPPIIFVRLVVPGWHRWSGAPDHRDYLASLHRHLWHFEIRMPVTHDDREVEFHDLMQAVRIHLRTLFPETHEADGHDFGERSCEAIAGELGFILADAYRRLVVVSVSEDGEAGAEVMVEWTPPASPKPVVTLAEHPPGATGAAQG